MVEMAVVLPVCLLLFTGIADLAISLHQRNVVSWIAREAARESTVHGSASSFKGPWGPDPVTWSHELGSEDQTSRAIMSALEPYSDFLRDPDCRIVFEWPDGSNHWGDTVRVTVRIPNRSLVPNWFRRENGEHIASCTMYIAH